MRLSFYTGMVSAAFLAATSHGFSYIDASDVQDDSPALSLAEVNSLFEGVDADDPQHMDIVANLLAQASSETTAEALQRRTSSSRHHQTSSRHGHHPH